MHGEIRSILTLLSDICGAVLFLFVSVGRQCHVPSIVLIQPYRGVRSTDTYSFIGAFECVRVTYIFLVFERSTAIWHYGGLHIPM